MKYYKIFKEDGVFKDLNKKRNVLLAILKIKKKKIITSTEYKFILKYD